MPECALAMEPVCSSPGTSLGTSSLIRNGITDARVCIFNDIHIIFTRHFSVLLLCVFYFSTRLVLAFVARLTVSFFHRLLLDVFPGHCWQQFSHVSSAPAHDIYTLIRLLGGSS